MSRPTSKRPSGPLSPEEQARLAELEAIISKATS